MNQWMNFFLSIFISSVFSVGYAQSLLKELKSTQTGISFQNDISESDQHNVLSYEYFYNGGGVAVGDINNDGLEDLFFTANMGDNALYLNKGNLKFENITQKANPMLLGRKGGWKTGVAMADVNGDGFLDIYVCYSGKGNDDLRRNQLFINQGNLTFSEKSKEYGLDLPNYSTQAGFLDIDGDGDLDMFLLNHNVKKIDNLELATFKNATDPLAGNMLLENVHGKFVDISNKAGIKQYPLTFGLGLGIADLNGDGLQDIYVSNDYNESDYIYINHGDKTFSENTEKQLRHQAQFSMGVNLADLNNDGYMDILSLDMLPEDNRRQKLLQLQENYEAFFLMRQQGMSKQYMHNMLQINNGDNTFSEIAQIAGVSNTDWSWSPLIGDLDNDGWKDIYITNGYMRDYTNMDFLKYWGNYKINMAMQGKPEKTSEIIQAMPSTLLHDYVFKNNGNLTFSDKKHQWMSPKKTLSNGAVMADLDQDGDLDIVTNNINQQASLYENRLDKSHAYLDILLFAERPEKTIVGTKAYLYHHGTVQFCELSPYNGYLSSQSSVLHFGIPQTTTIDSLRVVWIDQREQTFKGIEPNQRLKVYQVNAKNLLPKMERTRTPIFLEIPSPIAYTHDPYIENDFKRQPLLLYMYSATGPVMAKADINQDGLEDVFISGDQHQYAQFWIQQKSGGFIRDTTQIMIGDERTSSIAGASFFDANQDGYPDLYIAKGGYSLFEPNTPSLQDELYINQRNGGFSLCQNCLPNLSQNSKQAIAIADIDGDGDQDLFVGGRVVPGKYPQTPQSYLLVNDGKGIFTSVAFAGEQVGMVTDAVFFDLNKDRKPDLILCGEYMPMTVLVNKGNHQFENETASYFDSTDVGLWNTILLKDLNQDGKMDIVAGNYGRNSQIKATKKQPAELYFDDFDGNGSIDPFFNFYIQGVSYPFVSRDELNDQIYAKRSLFHYYKDYANATMKDIFSEKELKKAKKRTIHELESVVYVQQDGKFIKKSLPIEAQWAPVTNIQCEDFNQDGFLDILLLGNKSDNRLKLGAMDANYGCVLLGNAQGTFSYLPQTASGLHLNGDVKSVLQLDKHVFLFGSFGEPIQCYKKR